MGKFFTFKGGVSPIVATVLLISFAVALGSVILQWLVTFDFQDKCRNVQLSLAQSDNAGLCHGGLAQNGYLNFAVKNSGARDIHGIEILLVGETGSKLIDIDDALIARGSLYEKYDKSAAYDYSTYGKIRNAVIIPKIEGDGSREVCPKNAVTADEISPCV
jgi:hypothetical protein